MVRLRRRRLLDPESRRRRAFFARHPYRFCFCLCFCHLLSSGAADFGAPTARAALEHVSVMQQAIQHGGDGGAVAQQFAPVVYWSFDVISVLARS